jgi:hypothetical protein
LSHATAQKIVLVALAELSALAVVLLVAAFVPGSEIHSAADWIRRPGDVTPDRIVRYRIACVALSLLLGAGFVVLRQVREAAVRWLESAAGEFRTGLSVRKAVSAIPLDGWCVIAVGIALRALPLNDSMAYDEAYTFLNFARRPWYEAIADYNSTNNHLLNTLLMHVCYRFGGAQEWVLRLPVFIAGCLTLPLTYLWAQEWLGRKAALIATTLVAISPLMITYSADARGYMFVTAAALAIDLAVGRIVGDERRPRLAWLIVVIAAALGLMAMPIGLYPIAGSVVWYLIVRQQKARPANDLTKLASLTANLTPVIVAGLATAIVVGAFYAPAYIFRGLMFLRDPIMVPTTLTSLPGAMADGFRETAVWWTEGIVPRLCWLALISLGLATWGRTRDWIRLASPFAVVLFLNLLQRAAPPPRVLLFLFPWVALIAARGIETLVVHLFGRRRFDPRTPLHQQIALQSLAGLACFFGAHWAVTHTPILPTAERASFVSVRSVMEYLGSRVHEQTGSRHRLIAPLPCDLPALFYRERMGIPVEVNGLPQPGEWLWIITRPRETPEEVLASPLIQLGDEAVSLGPWKDEVGFRTLAIRESTHPVPAAVEHEAAQTP